MAGPRPGRRRLLVGWALAVGALGGCSGDPAPAPPTTTAAPETTTTTEPPLEAGEQRFVFAPEVGDCFDRRTLDQSQRASPNDPTNIVLLLDCELPHRFEVYAVVDVADLGRPYPGEEALEKAAKAACPEPFEAYVGRPYVDSALEITVETPRPDAWEAGNRTVACVLYDLDGAKLVGSMAGSAR